MVSINDGSVKFERKNSKEQEEAADNLFEEWKEKEETEWRQTLQLWLAGKERKIRWRTQQEEEQEPSIQERGNLMVEERN